VREALISGSRASVDPGHTVRRRARGVSVLPLLPLLALPACGKPGSGSSTGPAAAQVTAETATPQDVAVTFEFVAQTQSSRQVNIQARVTGFLEKRLYTEGGPVKEGQILFLMDKRPFQAQVDAEAAALARQQASLEVARADLERTKPLAAQNALSQKDLDDATGQFHAAQAAVEGAKAQLETAKLHLSYCTITSPVTGVAGAALQQEGSFVSPQTSLLTTVAALDPMWVNFSVSENQMQAYQDALANGVFSAPQFAPRCRRSLECCRPRAPGRRSACRGPRRPKPRRSPGGAWAVRRHAPPCPRRSRGLGASIPGARRAGRRPAPERSGPRSRARRRAMSGSRPDW
jgi:biotin carboxyl carrier protein